MRKGIPYDIAAKTVEDMVSEGLLSEERQLESAVFSLAEHKLFGPYRIMSHLCSKGYKSEDVRAAIHAALDSGEIDFSKNAALLIAKKLGDAPEFEEKRKLLFTYGYKK